MDLTPQTSDLGNADVDRLLGRLFVVTSAIISATIFVLCQRHWLAGESLDAFVTLAAATLCAVLGTIVYFRRSAVGWASMLVCWSLGAVIVLRTAAALWMASAPAESAQAYSFHAFVPLAIIVNFVFLPRWLAVALSAGTVIGLSASTAWFMVSAVQSGRNPDLSLLDANVIAPAAFVVLMSVYSRLRQTFEDNVAARERAETKAEMDSLTQVLNRRGFERRFEEATGGYGFAIVDVDHFKRINDEHGHCRGDEILKTVARTLRQGCRGTDLVGRWGGEEFVIRFQRCDTEANGLRAAEKLRLLVYAETGVTVSVGVVVDPAGLMPLSKSVARADAALYGAKESGRDRVAIWTATTDDVETQPVIPEPQTSDLAVLVETT